jgi:hypothetical protein
MKDFVKHIINNDDVSLLYQAFIFSSSSLHPDIEIDKTKGIINNIALTENTFNHKHEDKESWERLGQKIFRSAKRLFTEIRSTFLD